MNKCVIGIVLAVSVVGGLAAANGATRNMASPSEAGVQVMRLDGCPYYPSPVVCRDGFPQTVNPRGR